MIGGICANGWHYGCLSSFRWRRFDDGAVLAPHAKPFVNSASDSCCFARIYPLKKINKINVFHYVSPLIEFGGCCWSTVKVVCQCFCDPFRVQGKSLTVARGLILLLYFMY